MKCVYLIRSLHSPDHYKIGVTGDWERRAKELRVNYLTEEIFRYDIANAYQVEKELHQQFERTRLPQSEWFLLDIADVVYIQRLLIEISSTIRTAEEGSHCEDLHSTLESPAPKSPALKSDLSVDTEVPTQGDSMRADYTIQALGQATFVILGVLGLYLLAGRIPTLLSSNTSSQTTSAGYQSASSPKPNTWNAFSYNSTTGYYSWAQASSYRDAAKAAERICNRSSREGICFSMAARANRYFALSGKPGMLGHDFYTDKDANNADEAREKALDKCQELSYKQKDLCKVYRVIGPSL